MLSLRLEGQLSSRQSRKLVPRLAPFCSLLPEQPQPRTLRFCPVARVQSASGLTNQEMRRHLLRHRRNEDHLKGNSVSREDRRISVDHQCWLCAQEMLDLLDKVKSFNLEVAGV